MITKENIETTPLYNLIDELCSIDNYIDGLLDIYNTEINPDVKINLGKEIGLAEQHYKLIKHELERRWGNTFVKVLSR